VQERRITSSAASTAGASRGEGRWLHGLERNPGVQQVGTIPVRGMSDIRLLDDFAPPGARRYRRENRDDYDLRVYLVNGPTQ
jgi:hypothetical protein